MEEGYGVRLEEEGRGYGVRWEEEGRGYGVRWEEELWKRGIGLGGRRREGGMGLGGMREKGMQGERWASVFFRRARDSSDLTNPNSLQLDERLQRVKPLRYPPANLIRGKLSFYWSSDRHSELSPPRKECK